MARKITLAEAAEQHNVPASAAQRAVALGELEIDENGKLPAADAAAWDPLINAAEAAEWTASQDSRPVTEKRALRIFHEHCDELTSAGRRWFVRLSVFRRAFRHGVKQTGRRMEITGATRQKAIEMRQRGASFAEIAKTLNISRDTAWRSFHGITTSPLGSGKVSTVTRKKAKQ